MQVINQLVFVIILLFLFYSIKLLYARTGDSVIYQFSYTGSYSHLKASGGESGWMTKESAVESASSSIYFKIHGDDDWFKHLEFELYTNEGLVPKSFGEDAYNKNISLEKIAVIWGISKDLIPSIKISRTVFSAVGIVDGSVPYIKMVNY